MRGVVARRVRGGYGGAMATTQSDIRQWLRAAKAKGATHMLVVCDAFDWCDYPVNVMPGEDPATKAKEYAIGKNAQKVVECYALHLDIEAQLAERRAHHYEAAP